MKARNALVLLGCALAAACSVSKNDAVSGSWEAKWECKPWSMEGQPGCKAACDSGHIAQACGHYGVHAEHLAPTERVAYLRLGCVGASGDELDACQALVSHLAKGQGAPRDLASAHPLVDRLCASGQECRCTPLAQLYGEASMQDDDAFAARAFAAWCAGACEVEGKASLCARLASAGHAAAP